MNKKIEARLNVCIVAPEMPPVIGGAETFSEVLVLSLIAKGTQVFVVTSKNPRKIVADQIERSGGKLFVIGEDLCIADGYVAWEWMTFSRAEALYKVISENDIDIVHALSHDTILSSSIAICDLQCGKKPKLVATTSEMSTEDSGFGISRSKFIYSLPIDGLVQLSEYYLNLARKYGCKPEKEIISSAVEILKCLIQVRSKKDILF